MSTSERGQTAAWHRVKELFAACIELDEIARARFLAEACGDDPPIRNRVVALIRSHERAPEFLDDFAASISETGVPSEDDDRDADADPARWRHVGPYRLGRVLGEGGVGLVYEAFQERPSRSVALKILRPSVVSKASVQRFQYEVEILGRLQHPGIAQIFEAGLHREATDGAEMMVPYFAMEHVDGVVITKFCEPLPPRERLRLFLEVCDAVEYAHQRGVIHRDLKPANLLVTGGAGRGDPPRVKVLDFGIARATNPDATLTVQTTAPGLAVGTLPYMSPEQIEGDPRELDVRADVYSLGVVLYELLVGRLPLDVDSDTFARGARRVIDEEPPPPSLHDAACRGDLDTIAATALAKEKSRRYGSVSEFAADVRRYLRDEPIAARPASLGYQLAKFARRHRGLMVGLSATFVLLLAAIAATVVGLERTRVEQRRTAAERDKATAILSLLTGMLAAPSPFEEGADVTVVALLDQTVAGLGANHPPDVEAELRRTIGDTYMQLGRTAEGVAQLERAANLFEGSLGPRHEQALAARVQLVRPSNLPSHEERDAAARRLLQTCVDALGPEHRVTLDAARAHASILLGLNRVEEAKAACLSTLDVQRRRLGPEDHDTLATRSLLASILLQQEQYEEVVAIRTDILAIELRHHGEDHASTVVAKQALAITLDRLGRHAEAEPYHRGLRERAIRLFGADHSRTFHVEEGLAQNLVHQQRLAEAEEILTDGLERARRLGALPQRLNSLAVLYGAQGRTEEAEDCARRSVEATRALRGENSVTTLIAVENWAVSLTKLERFDEALALFAESLPRARAIYGPRSAELVSSLNLYGNCYAAMTRWAEAEPLYRDAVSIARDTMTEDHVLRVTAVSSLGICLSQLGRLDDAEPLLVEAEQGWRSAPATYRNRRENVLRELISVYLRRGDSDRAAEVRRVLEHHAD